MYALPSLAQVAVLSGATTGYDLYCICNCRCDFATTFSLLVTVRIFNKPLYFNMIGTLYSKWHTA